jgi:hypothetical protein
LFEKSVSISFKRVIIIEQPKGNSSFSGKEPLIPLAKSPVSELFLITLSNFYQIRNLLIEDKAVLLYFFMDEH